MCLHFKNKPKIKWVYSYFLYYLTKDRKGSPAICFLQEVTWEMYHGLSQHFPFIGAQEGVGKPIPDPPRSVAFRVVNYEEAVNFFLFRN